MFVEFTIEEVPNYPSPREVATSIFKEFNISVEEPIKVDKDKCSWKVRVDDSFDFRKFDSWMRKYVTYLYTEHYMREVDYSVRYDNGDNVFKMSDDIFECVKGIVVAPNEVRIDFTISEVFGQQTPVEVADLIFKKLCTEVQEVHHVFDGVWYWIISLPANLDVEEFDSWMHKYATYLYNYQNGRELKWSVIQ